LLSLRDGFWRPVSDLAAWLAPRVPGEFAVHRYLSSGGNLGRKLDHKCGEGQKLILEDILAALKSKSLLSVRGEVGEEVRVTPFQDDRFDIDPEFENLLPRAPDEAQKLEERLLIEGARDPLVVWKGHRLLVDGHTRYRFLSLLGLGYSVVEAEFPDRAAVIAWLYDTHYGRRNYSPEMKSYVRGKQYLTRKQRHGGARKKASARSEHLKTADAVAAEYGVGRTTVRRDADFAEALDRVAGHCGDEVRQQVLSRAARWTRRDVERLAELDKAATQEAVRVALAAGRRPKFPPPEGGKGPGGTSVRLPLGRPGEQVRVLRGILGDEGLAQLRSAITRSLEERPP
jgi:hypothetical protein